MQEPQPALTSAPSPATPVASPPLAASSFNPDQATPSKKKVPLKMILGGLVFILLLVGAGAGYYLTQINQDVRQQASTGVYGAGYRKTSTGCVACTGSESESVLQTCTYSEPTCGATPTNKTCWNSSCQTTVVQTQTCPNSHPLPIKPSSCDQAATCQAGGTVPAGQSLTCYYP